MYITTNPVNQEIFKNFEAAKNCSKNNCDAKYISTEKKEEKFNVPVLASTTIGVLASMLLIRRYKNTSAERPFIKLSESTGILKKLNAIKENVKNLFNIGTELKVDAGLKEMIVLGGGSILGGLAGGIAFDKDRDKNTKNKVKESIYQFINIVIPTTLVTGLLKVAEIYKLKNKLNKNKIVSDLSKIAENCNETNNYNAISKITKNIQQINNKYHLKNNIAHIGAALLGIGLGMPIASYVSNKINNSDKNDTQIYKRSMKLKDMTMHLDDIIGALIIAKVPFANKLGIDKILPLVYLTSGYEAGKQKQK